MTPTKRKALTTTGIIAAIIAALVGVVALFPDKTLGTAISVVSNDPTDSHDVIKGEMPEISRMVDARGGVIAAFYDQRRVSVPRSAIPDHVVNAVVAIEDRRFYEHEGVDWKAVARAAVGELFRDSTAGGGSTLTQQYVKNYLWLISGHDEATEHSYRRKMREMDLARQVDSELTKDEIVTRYLNLVSFGNGAYGIQEAAQTYFGVDVQELTDAQGAMLAGLIQSPEGTNPYSDPEGTKNRRGEVLAAMVDTGVMDPGRARQIDGEPLGALPEPNTASPGCGAAGTEAFFCDFVVDWLADNGVSMERLNQGGMTIETTLDPVAQNAAVTALDEYVPVGEPNGVAAVTTLIEPAESSRPVRAFATNVPYGTDEEAGQTVLPLATTPQGAGVGSVNKIFAAAAALGNGWGIRNEVAVPNTYQADGLGESGGDCPAGKFCVSNAGTYPDTMTVQDALAHSPNTPFVKMAEDAGNTAVVDAAVKMGLRSFDTGDGDQVGKLARQGSFVLGPEPTAPLELSNAMATLSGRGQWCAPLPVTEITDGHQREPIDFKPCERAVDSRLASALLDGLSHDAPEGTAKQAAANTGWDLPLASKTGTTSESKSAAFAASTSGLSGSTYVFDYAGSSSLCTGPLRVCETGDLYGGQEPAEIMLRTLAPISGSEGYAAESLAAADENPYLTGVAGRVDDVVGAPEAGARRALESLGYRVASDVDRREVDSGVGRVVEVARPDGDTPGAELKLVVGEKKTTVAPRSSSTVTTSTPRQSGGERGAGRRSAEPSPAPSRPYAPGTQSGGGAGERSLTDELRGRLGI